MPMLVEVPAATAYRYDRDVLEADLPPPNFDNIRALLVDEKAVHKGHGYVTSVLNADTGELLHLHEGKKKASLEAFCLSFRTMLKARDIQLAVFEEQVGWEVGGFIEEPHRLCDIVNWDCLMDLASSVGIDPIATLPPGNQLSEQAVDGNPR